MEHLSTVSLPTSERGSSSVAASDATLIGSGNSSKVSTLDRNNQKWDMYKDDIRRMYLDRDKTLKSAMQYIESVHHFTASERKWKMKLKEWNFEKNIPAKELGIMVEIAEKRKREEGKETVFLRGGLVVPCEKFESFKKRKIDGEAEIKAQVIETPPNVTYHSPSVTEYEEFDDDVMDVDTSQAVSLESESLAQTPPACIDPSKLLHQKPKTVDSRKTRFAEVLGIELRKTRPEIQKMEVLGQKRSESPRPLPSIDWARRLKTSERPSDAIRYYIRALFESIYFPQEQLSTMVWSDCLYNLSSLLNGRGMEKKQVKDVFREEFKLTNTYPQLWVRSSDERSYTHRLWEIWRGVLKYESLNWTQESQDIAEWFIQAFPRSKRWRFRLELTKALSCKFMHAHAAHQLLLSLCEIFVQWKTPAHRNTCHEYAEKIFRAISFGKYPNANKYLTSLFPRVKILEDGRNVYRRLRERPVYLISCLARSSFLKDLWGWGNDLADTIRLEGEDEGHDESWVLLYLDLFDIYFQDGRLSDAAASISRAIQINLWGISESSKRRKRSLISKDKFQGRWQQFLNLSPEALPPSIAQQLDQINDALKYWSKDGSKAKNNSSDDATTESASVYTGGTGEKSEFGDYASSGYGITYTESLFSELSLNYSELFPSNLRHG
ncbi:hypothetical protein BDZ45DRAFT_778014 [Acephala macrosclerotiorum]|nr:hypothetical protein BDZ45DRAFT_778014 [Acephala macrosclerotiorum]